jgi:hypothetical protein
LSAAPRLGEAAAEVQTKVPSASAWPRWWLLPGYARRSSTRISNRRKPARRTIKHLAHA